MRVLSATEAIAPAWKRAWEMLFAPFRAGRSWKLGAVALVSCCAITYLPDISFRSGVPADATVRAQMVYQSMQGFAIIMAVMVTVIGLVFFYFGARMQFVLMETTATRQTMVAPIWAKYGDRTWRWVGLKIMPSVLLLFPFIFFIRRLMWKMTALQAAHRGQPPQADFFVHLFAIIAGIWLIGLTAKYVSGLVNDFLLPPIALENCSIALAFNRFGRAFTEDPGEFVLYMLLKLVLLFVFGIAGYIVTGLVIGIPSVVAGVCIFLMIHLAHGIGAYIAVGLGCALLALIGAAYCLYAGTLIMGLVVTFFQAYSMYFYGGRYFPLGDLLEPPIAPVAPYEAAPPVDDVPPMFPPPEAVG
jgi:hypothetical protein